MTPGQEVLRTGRSSGGAGVRYAEDTRVAHSLALAPLSVPRVRVPGPDKWGDGDHMTQLEGWVCMEGESPGP